MASSGRLDEDAVPPPPPAPLYREVTQPEFSAATARFYRGISAATDAVAQAPLSQTDRSDLKTCITQRQIFISFPVSGIGGFFLYQAAQGMFKNSSAGRKVWGPIIAATLPFLYLCVNPKSPLLIACYGGLLGRPGPGPAALRNAFASATAAEGDARTPFLIAAAAAAHHLEHVECKAAGAEGEWGFEVSSDEAEADADTGEGQQGSGGTKPAARSGPRRMRPIAVWGTWLSDYLPGATASQEAGKGGDAGQRGRIFLPVWPPLTPLPPLPPASDSAAREGEASEEGYSFASAPPAAHARKPAASLPRPAASPHTVEAGEYPGLSFDLGAQQTPPSAEESAFEAGSGGTTAGGGFEATHAASGGQEASEREHRSRSWKGRFKWTERVEGPEGPRGEGFSFEREQPRDAPDSFAAGADSTASGGGFEEAPAEAASPDPFAVAWGDEGEAGQRGKGKHGKNGKRE